MSGRRRGTGTRRCGRPCHRDGHPGLAGHQQRAADDVASGDRDEVACCVARRNGALEHPMWEGLAESQRDLGRRHLDSGGADSAAADASPPDPHHRAQAHGAGSDEADRPGHRDEVVGDEELRPVHDHPRQSQADREPADQARQAQHQRRARHRDQGEHRAQRDLGPGQHRQHARRGQVAFGLGHPQAFGEAGDLAWGVGSQAQWEGSRRQGWAAGGGRPMTRLFSGLRMSAVRSTPMTSNATLS